MSLPFQRPPKMPSMIPPRFLHLRGSQQGMVWLTKMVSSVESNGNKSRG